MAAATIQACHGNLRRVLIDNTTTSIVAGGGVVHRIFVDASTSGTLILADGRGNLWASALSLTAETVVDVGVPFEGDLTLTGGGTFTATLVIEG